MAIGFTPKHIEIVSLSGLDKDTFLSLAIEAGHQSGWNIHYLSPTGFLAYTNKGMMKWNANIKLTLKDGMAVFQNESAGNELWDMGRNKKNLHSYLITLEQLKVNRSPEKVVHFTHAIKKAMAETEQEDLLQLPPPTKTEHIRDFFSFFVPAEGYFITPILLVVNLLLFTIMSLTGVNVFSPDEASLILWGANFTPLTLHGEIWRLLTSCFLHIGIFHLLMNMYAFWYIGMLLEPHLGRLRFFMAYLATGILASVTSLWWHDFTLSAGASGAIFGMYGVFLAMLTTNFFEPTTRKAMLANIGVFVVFNLMYGMKGGIDNAAHIGGLLGGLVLGYLFYPSLRKYNNQSLYYGTLIGGIFLLLGISLMVFRLIHKT